MTSIIRRHPRKLIAAGAITMAIVYSDSLPNPLRTPGVQNIEKRYISGGGSINHTPSIATKLGDHDHITGKGEKTKGVGTAHFEEHYGGQKPEGSKFDEKFNDLNYNSKKGK